MKVCKNHTSSQTRFYQEGPITVEQWQIKEVGEINSDPGSEFGNPLPRRIHSAT
jgi:hypothetical protein